MLYQLSHPVTLYYIDRSDRDNTVTAFSLALDYYVLVLVLQSSVVAGTLES